MANAFIFHGTYGYPEENWFPWLKYELEKLGCDTTVPKFPTPENQTLANWLKLFTPLEGKLNSETILIGHSMGSAFALDILQMKARKVRAVFLVSPSIADLPDPEDKFNKLNRSFYEKGFDWNTIKESSNSFHAIGSDNDPYIPMSEMEKVAKYLGIKLTVIKGAGHFNKKAGYAEFPQLLAMIKEAL